MLAFLKVSKLYCAKQSFPAESRHILLTTCREDNMQSRLALRVGKLIPFTGY